MSLLLLFQGDGATPQGWQAPLSNAPLSTTVAAVLIAASAGLSVPLAPPAVAPATAIGVPLHSGDATPRIRRVYAQTRSDPLYVAPVVVATTPPHWQAPLSTAVPVARASDANQSFPFFTPNVITTSWQGPLSAAPAVAKAQAGFADVPFNTAQRSVNYTVFGWYAPLSGAPAVAKAQFSDWSLPYNVVNVVTTAWQSQLSVAPAVAKAQAGFASSPLYVPPSAAGIAGMAWFTPLWSVPMRNLVAPPGDSFVPTTQQIVVTTPGRRRPILFIANVGRLMN